MERALLVAVRFHEGRYHGTGGWPPAPARLFQALMAGAARGAEIPVAARDALDWLERLPPPVIAAPRGEPSQGYTAFVPNNDLDAALSEKQATGIEDAVASARVGKTVRPTLFDASAPLLYCWHFGGDEAPAAGLCETAGQLYQLGRGIDAAWADAAVLEADMAKKRLSSHSGIVYRPTASGRSGSKLLCPRPGTPGPLVLGDGRYLGLGLMCAVDRMPGVLAFAIKGGLAALDPALVARAARRAMLARVQAALPPGRSLPTYVTGHEDDGSPARSGIHRHISVVPDLSRRRLLYIAPSWLQRTGVNWREVSRDHAGVEGALEGMAVLRAGRAGRLTLAPSTVETERDPLFAPSREWQSVSDYRVTRHRRRLGDAGALTADAVVELDRIGWPAPVGVEVLSVRRGARGGLSGRLRLTFATAQEGPLVIGRTAHTGGGLFAAPA